MQRTLSVRNTGLLKFALPPVWLGFVAYMAWQLWSRPENVLVDRGAGSETTILRWIFLVLLALSVLVLFAFVVPLKRVRLGEDGLYVSNYVREITVPFGAIKSVQQNWLPTFRLISLELHNETALGRRVVFMPAGALRVAFGRAADRRDDDLAHELRKLAGLTD